MAAGVVYTTDVTGVTARRSELVFLKHKVSRSGLVARADNRLCF